MRFKRITGFILLLVVLYLAGQPLMLQRYTGSIKNRLQGKTLNNRFAVKIKSGSLSTDYTLEEALNDREKFGFNTLNVPVVIDIASLNASDMSVNTGSKKQAVRLIKMLNARGINTILEPYPWIRNGSLYETEWMPSDMHAFFNNWKSKVLQELIRDIAVPYHTDALNIASNFINMEPWEKEWCDTVDFVRKHYKGLVTYRTAWWYTAQWDEPSKKAYEGKLQNRLFSRVDFISVSAYFELTNHPVNSVESLIQALEASQVYDRRQNIRQELKKLHDRWNKPIFFGELGFPKRKGAAFQPWNPAVTEVIDPGEQARCFEAYRTVFGKEPWVLGFSVFAVGRYGPDKVYYPGDESTEVLRNWEIR